MVLSQQVLAEVGFMPSGNPSSQDYVARARYLAGTQYTDSASTGSDSALDARRAIAKLERATTELRQGILGNDYESRILRGVADIYIGDNDNERKTQAEVLLNAYSRELERRRLAAGAQGLLISGYGTYHLLSCALSNVD